LTITPSPVPVTPLTPLILSIWRIFAVLVLAPLFALRVRLLGVSALKDQPAAYEREPKDDQRHAQSSHVATNKTAF
jgi:hypothetical protein